MNLRRTQPTRRQAAHAERVRLTARDLAALITFGGASIITARGVDIEIADGWTLDDVLQTLTDIEHLG